MLRELLSFCGSELLFEDGGHALLMAAAMRSDDGVLSALIDAGAR